MSIMDGFLVYLGFVFAKFAIGIGIVALLFAAVAAWAAVDHFILLPLRMRKRRKAAEAKARSARGAQ